MHATPVRYSTLCELANSYSTSVPLSLYRKYPTIPADSHSLATRVEQTLNKHLSPASGGRKSVLLGARLDEMTPCALKYGNREEVMRKAGGEDARSVRAVCDVCAAQGCRRC